MLNTILVPLDGSPASEQALPVALVIARLIGATVDLAHVHQVLPYLGLAPAYDDTLDIEEAHRMREPIVALAQRSTEEHGVPVTATLLFGPAASTLEQYVSAHGVRLIVMTTHGRGGLSRALMGNVADRLVRQSATPVLLVRPVDGAVPATAGWPPHRVLVPLDGSRLAEEVLAPLTQFIGPAGTELVLLRVMEPMPSLEPFPDIAGLVDGAATQERLDDADAESVDEAQNYLDGFAGRLPTDHSRVRTHVVVHSSPARAILEYATAIDAGLVALATHGRSGLARAFAGSVADKVMREATVSVLVVRPAPDPDEGPGGMDEVPRGGGPES
jgi:nucleotide-binding universal stress UspA family protein